ncbi:hypothetical protein SAMN05444360_12234 [Chryseobacterium carnipullorum]|nr:hypothetical protein SAMN05444360_12234 [Chryseobacterium carnipullorum]
MTSKEYTEYDRLTHEMELHFIALTPQFMEYCENVIFGDEIEDLRYYCFHFYNVIWNTKLRILCTGEIRYCRIRI